MKKLIFLVQIFVAGSLVLQQSFARKGVRELRLPVRIGPYGDILKADPGYIKDAVLEKIVLHSRVNEYSDEMLSRNGLLIRYPQTKGTILISHGFMCDKFDVGLLRQIFPALDFDIMTFDYRAHGENAHGQSCTFGKDEVHDLVAAARFLQHHPATQEKPIILYGFSMGAATAIEAQAKYPDLFDAMILDCPFASTAEVMEKSIENLKMSVFGYTFAIPGCSVLKKYAFHPYVQSVLKVLLKSIAKLDATQINTRMYPLSPAESVKNITVPCFFIHCKNDEKISAESVKQIFTNARGYKKLWLTNGRNHFDSFMYNPETYTRRVRKFIGQVVAGKLTGDKKVIEDVEDIFNQESKG